MDSRLIPIEDDEVVKRIAQAILSIHDVEIYTDSGHGRIRNISEEDIKNAKIKVYYYEKEKQSDDDSSRYIALPYEIAKDIYHTYANILTVIIKDRERKNKQTICTAPVYEVILWMEVQKDTVNEFINGGRDIVDKAISMYFCYKINAIVHKSRYSNSRIGQSVDGYITFHLYNKLFPVKVNERADNILEQILAYMLIR
ncbi:MAG: hypothetical protein QXF17_04255 [Ignisphaera sp.]